MAGNRAHNENSLASTSRVPWQASLTICFPALPLQFTYAQKVSVCTDWAKREFEGRNIAYDLKIEAGGQLTVSCSAPKSGPASKDGNVTPWADRTFLDAVRNSYYEAVRRELRNMGLKPQFPEC